MPAKKPEGTSAAFIARLEPGFASEHVNESSGGAIVDWHRHLLAVHTEEDLLGAHHFLFRQEALVSVSAPGSDLSCTFSNATTRIDARTLAGSLPASMSGGW